jgi:hypothetical protein
MGMTTTHAVHVDVESPRHYDRSQLLLRLLLGAVVGAIGVTGDWLAGVVFGLLPLIAAIGLSTRNNTRFFTEVAPGISKVVRWLMQLSAYMLLLVDRFPMSNTEPVRIEIRCTGTPSVGSSLLRLLTSIPSAFVLMLLWCISCVMWIVGAITILVDRRVPELVLAFQRGVLRWQTHLLAYHASLVDEYPPFSFDGGAHDHSPRAAAGVIP